MHVRRCIRSTKMVLLISLLAVCTRSQHVDQWESYESVATSSRPDFYCLVKGSRVTLVSSDREPIPGYRITPSSFPLPTGQHDTLPIAITQSTSQGPASLTIKIASSKLLLGPADIQVNRLILRSSTRRKSNPQAISQLHWSTQFDKLNFSVLIYNRTHVLQRTVFGTSTFLDDLRPAGRYEFCVQPEILMCRASWTCITRVIPASEETSLSGGKKSVSIRNLKLVGLGSDWLQLSWLPPQHSLLDAQHRSPRAYVISIEPVGRSCQRLTYYVQAPWIEPDDVEALHSDLEEARRASCGADEIPVKLEPLGFWSDWEHAEELMDEFGSLGELTVTVEKLWPNRRYSVGVTPVVSKTNGPVDISYVDVSTADDTRAGCEVTQHPFSVALFSKFTPLNTANLTTFHIGRPVHYRKCTTNCVISSEPFARQPTGAPQRMHVSTASFKLTSLQTLHRLPTDHLFPCRIYELVVHVKYDESLECRRRVVLPLVKDTDGSNLPVVEVKSLARNFLLVQFEKQKAVNHVTCPPIGYVIKPSVNGGLGSWPTPIIVTAEDLELARLPPVFPVDTKATSGRQLCTLLLPNPSPSANEVKFHVDMITWSGIKKTTKVLHGKQACANCHLDCLWWIPVPSFHRSQTSISTDLRNEPVQSKSHTLCREEWEGSVTQEYQQCYEKVLLPCIDASINSTSSSISLFWSDQAIGLTKFESSLANVAEFSVILYRVVDEAYGGESGIYVRNASKSIGASNHLSPVSQIFTELNQTTTYLVVVKVRNEDGQEGSTWRRCAATGLAVPCAPQNVTFEAVEQSALTIGWKPGPSTHCGAANDLIREHCIGKKPEDCPIKQRLRVTLPLSNPKGGTVTLRNLSACTSYCIVLSLKNEIGVGPESLTVCRKTRRPEFSGWPVLKNVQCTSSRYANNGSEICQIMVASNYPETCHVEYEGEIRLRRSRTTMKSHSLVPIMTFDRGLQAGRIYEVRVRLSVGGSSNRSSSWSTWTKAITKSSWFRVKEFSVSVIPPQSEGDGDAWPMKSLDLKVDLKVHGQMHGLYGLYIQTFGQERMAKAFHEEDMGSADALSNLERIAGGPEETLNEQHLGDFWLECSDCLGEHYWELSDSVYRQMVAHINIFRRSNSRLDNQTALMSYLRSNTIPNSATLLKANTSVVSFNVPIATAVDVRQKRLVEPSFDNTIADTSELRNMKKQLRYTAGRIVVYAATLQEFSQFCADQWHLYGSHAEQLPRFWRWIIMFIVLTILILAIGIFVPLFLGSKRKKQGHLRHQKNTEDADLVTYLKLEDPIVPSREVEHINDPEATTIEDFANWVDSNASDDFTRLRSEFKLLTRKSLLQRQRRQLTTFVGERTENKLRNRYTNLLPYDHNCVRLLEPCCLDICLGDGVQTQEDAGSEITPGDVDLASCPEARAESDYVNASRITGRAPNVPLCLVSSSSRDGLSSRLPRSYIAAQAPVGHTRGIFWQMIWDNGVQLIVMLTRTVENGKKKCVNYWPEVKTDSSRVPPTDRYGNFKVTLIEEKNQGIYFKRKLSVKNMANETGKPRIITQLHMVQWPDFFSPSCENFRQLLYAYWTERRNAAQQEAPVLIHCSAGVGRTGVFICLDQLCHQIRYILRPDYEPERLTSELCSEEEPIYQNLDSTGNHEALKDVKKGEDGWTDRPNSKTLELAAERQKEDQSGPVDKESLANSVSFSGRIGLKRKSTQRSTSDEGGRSRCIDVYNTVLWLRANRTNMVQSADQYVFLYRFLAYFIRSICDSEM